LVTTEYSFCIKAAITSDEKKVYETTRSVFEGGERKSGILKLGGQSPYQQRAGNKRGETVANSSTLALLKLWLSDG